MLELEQSSESRSSESGCGSTMDLGSVMAGLGWPVVVRTDRFVCLEPARRLACFWPLGRR